MTVNSGFYDFFENWWNHYVRLSLPYEVVVVAEDSAAYEKLILNPNITTERSSIQMASAYSHGSNEYNALVLTRPEHILRHLKGGKGVLYTDVDTVWLSDPTPYFRSHDITTQIDLPSYYCTGFMAIKSNKRTIAFIQRWKNACQLNPQSESDQPVFNRILHKTTNLKYRGLPLDLFPNGDLYFNKLTANEKQKTVVVHNNFIV